MKFKDINVQEDNMMLDEGPIRVPNVLLSKVQEYVSSVLMYYIQMQITNLPQDADTNQKKAEFQRALAHLQQNNGKNISKASFDKIINKALVIKIDLDQFFNELNYKNVTPEIIDLAKRKTTVLFVHSRDDVRAYGSLQNSESTDIIDINISRMKNSNNYLQTVKQILSTVYHECQHVVQFLAIQHISPNSTQMQSSEPSEKKSNDDYLQSGIEYTPQLGNLIDAVKDTLEDMYEKSELQGKKNIDVKSALEKTMQERAYSNQRAFLIAIYKKDKDLYNKTLKDIYKHVSSKYDELIKDGVKKDYEDRGEEEINTELDPSKTIYRVLTTMKNKCDIKAKGKLKTIYEIEVKSKTEDWELIYNFTKINANNTININFLSGEYREGVVVPSDQAIEFTQWLSTSPSLEPKDVYNALEINSKGSDIDSSVIMSMIEVAERIAKFSKLPFEMLSDSEFKFGDLVFKIEPSEGKSVLMSNDEYGLYFNVTTSAFQNLMNMCSALIRSGNEENLIMALASDTSSFAVMSAVKSEFNKIKNYGRD